MTGTVRELAAAFSTRVVRELSKPHPALWARQRVVPVAEVVDGDVPLSLAAGEAAAAFEILQAHTRVPRFHPEHIDLVHQPSFRGRTRRPTTVV